MVRVKRQHIPKKQIDYEHLSPNTIQLNVPIMLLANERYVSIDSTGVKITTGCFKVTSKMVKHVKEAYLEASLASPPVTDAVVEIELYNETDAEVVTKLTYSGEGGYKVSSNIASTLKTLTEKILCGRVNVTTASASSGVTQGIRSILLRLVLGIS